MMEDTKNNRVATVTIHDWIIRGLEFYRVNNNASPKIYVSITTEAYK